MGLEHRGNLNEAVNAHFSEGDRNINQRASLTSSGGDVMNIDYPISFMPHRPLSSLLPFGRDLNTFSLLDPSFTRNIFDVGNASTRSPFVSHPREVREIPIEVKDEPDAHGHSVDAPIIVDVTETAHEHGPEVRGTPVVDDDENSPSSPVTHATGHGAGGSSMNFGPSALNIVDVPDYGNDIEEEMIQAAIEASKQDAALPNQDVMAPAPESVQPHTADAELAHVVSLSLQTAEQEKVLREIEGKVGASEVGQVSANSDEIGELPSNGRQSRQEVGSSYFQDEAVDVEERPLVRRRRTRVSSGSMDPVRNTEVFETTPLLNPPPSDNVHHPQQIGSDFPSDVWGAISSEEHDEAVMLEAAMFGRIPNHLMQNGLGASVGPYPRNVPRPPSPSLAAQRLIREQQNGEYLAALQADQEKELKAKEEAEAALAEELHREEIFRRKLQDEQENERQLAAKEASLPQEPTAGNENAVTLLVRMPDGSRRGRRFLKTDNLQCLFDFIDIGRVVKPGSYRLVRPYPRRAFSGEESGSTLDELGLTSKQEALYLELI
ncbi:hypothetical protein ACS0TY_021613 [Phlomoides rotata]